MLRLKDVSYSINGNVILNDVSIFVEKGKISGIIGVSGAGKSTLLTLISGLVGPYTGQLTINAKMQEDFSQGLIPGNKLCKLVHQKNNLFPNISLVENLEYALRFYEKSYIKKRVEFLMNALEIEPLKNRLPKEVSGGELQRWQIACAIAEEPKVLLLDEPFSSLDPNTKTLLKPLISKLVLQEDIACVFVTHDMQDAFGMANTIFVLRNGSIVQQDEPQNLYEKPRTTYVAKLTGKANINTNKILTRPEWLSLSKESKMKGKVIDSYFVSPQFENLIKVQDELLYCYSETQLEKGQTVGVKVNKQHQLL